MARGAFGERWLTVLIPARSLPGTPRIPALAVLPNHPSTCPAGGTGVSVATRATAAALAQPGTEEQLRGDHRRFRGARPGHRVLPRPQPRDPRCRGAGEGWLAGGNMARNTTIIRSNYLFDESAAIYEHSLKLWEELPAELEYDFLLSQRGVLNLAHSEQEVRDFQRRAFANQLNG